MRTAGQYHSLHAPAPPAQQPATTRHLTGLSMILWLAGVNLFVWIVALAVFYRFPILLGPALIAYSFGLRHAFDADHIAAIDNTVRKQMASGERPIATGLYFSLGHSTIVFLLSAAVAVFTGAAIRSNAGSLTHAGELAGTLISAGLLFAIGIVNIAVLMPILRALHNVRQGTDYDEDKLDQILSGRGLLARLFRRVFALVRKSWHMYFIGLLFGLSFDTATEIGLIGISAAEASKGLPIFAIMIFPMLFAAGMALIDGLDSVMMVSAYAPQFSSPKWKLTYNAAVTSISVIIAFSVGGIELLQLLQDSLALSGPGWQWIGIAGSCLSWAGFGVAGIFAAIVGATLCSAMLRGRSSAAEAGKI